MTTTRQAWLDQPYSAYHHRDILKEDEELTHVGPGTPGGEYLRLFWQPIAICSELTDLPKAIKIMGEELVVFRDKNGRVGCLELHCSHRGTSLEFGLIEEQGIRCCYHGWLFDVDGKILDTPGEPPDSTYKERLCHGAYPTHEFSGLVFAYMGPSDKKPEFPNFDTFEAPPTSPGEEWPLLFVRQCNWLQILDNIVDLTHTVFLHARSSGSQFSDAFVEMPEYDWTETPIGMLYVATLRVASNVWIRVIDLIPPNIHQLANFWEHGEVEHHPHPAFQTGWFTPIDDTSTLCFNITWAHPDPQPPAEGYRSGYMEKISRSSMG